MVILPDNDGVSKKKVVVVIQARMGSRRLPGKAMLDLGGKSVLCRVIDRVKRARLPDEVWLATTVSAADDVLEREARQAGVFVYRGSGEDVLGRFCQVARLSGAGCVVRVTGDNPLTSPWFIDRVVAEQLAGDYDLVAFKGIPVGTGATAVSRAALPEAERLADGPADREHVTTYIKNRPGVFRVRYLQPEVGLRRPDVRVTLDTSADYRFLCALYGALGPVRDDIGVGEIVKFWDDSR